MARNTTITIAEGDWGQLTDANVTNITFQLLTPGQRIYVKGTIDATEPTDIAGAALYTSNEGEANIALSDLFPGISAVRVWAFNDAEGIGSVKVFVSHA